MTKNIVLKHHFKIVPLFFLLCSPSLSPLPVTPTYHEHEPGQPSSLGQCSKRETPHEHVESSRARLPPLSYEAVPVCVSLTIYPTQAGFQYFIPPFPGIEVFMCTLFRETSWLPVPLTFPVMLAAPRTGTLVLLRSPMVSESILATSASLFSSLPAPGSLWLCVLTLLHRLIFVCGSSDFPLVYLKWPSKCFSEG